MADLNTIRQRLAELSKQRQVIEEEEKELHLVERVLARLDAAERAKPTVTVEAPRAANRMTQQDMIVNTLERCESVWLDSSAALHEEIKRVHGADITKGSFKPLLSDLKKKGIVMRDERGRVALASRAREELFA